MAYQLTKNGRALKILPYTHPIFSQRIENELIFPLSQEIRELILLTGQTLKGDLGFFSNHCPGINAVNVGLPFRFFVLQNFKATHFPRLKYILNPDILEISEGSREWIAETCLSMGEAMGVKKRYTHIRVAYYTLNGKRKEETLKSDECYEFQVQYDRLEGKSILDDAIEEANEKYIEYFHNKKEAWRLEEYKINKDRIK